ncbi:MAG: dipeptidyl-peptidase 3 family protein [Acidobacteriota bacterium]
MTTNRQYLLEQVDDAAVVQYYADGFESLPLDQKVLIWHLYQAALAGRDIYYDQRYRHALAMRDLLEEILTHPDGVDPKVLTELRRYTKLFWINSGPHNNLTARKFVLKCTPEDLRAAALAEGPLQAFAAKGKTASDVVALLDQLRGPFFDPAVDAMVTQKTPEEGRDILEASANNLYAGVKMADLGSFDERHGPNSRLVRQSGRLVEEVYRVNGRYGELLSRVVHHLEAALPYAPPNTRRALEALIRLYRTGDDADRMSYDVAWVEDQDGSVDTINGFVESYLDARGVKGAWEGVVFYVNHAKTDGLRRLAAAAPWFEARMPWDPRWRRTDVVGVTARAIDVVVETGDAGPVTAIGINLPNDQRVREQHGSKSVSLANINEAYEKSQLPAYRREFCWSEDEIARAEKWSALASEATTAIHEVLGHGSGRVAEHLNGQPQLALKEQYSAIEEARADLVALYFLPDPKIAEVGLVPAEHQADVVLAEYESYARNALVQLRRVREGLTIEEDHMRNRQMIVHWLLANTNAIAVRKREGKTYYVTTDVAAFREGSGRLLAEVQRIKSEGDYAAARALFETYGIHVNPAIRDEVVARVDRLNLPSYTGFVQPRLKAVTDEGGKITDVRISYPRDFERQMLEYSGKLAPEEATA